MITIGLLFWRTVFKAMDEDVDDDNRLDILDCLPPELRREVLSRLSARDLANCSMVSKKWREMANENFYWKILLSQDTLSSEVLMPLNNIYDEYDTCLMKECEYKRYYERGTRAVTNLLKNRLTKRQLEDCSVEPLANGSVLAAISSRLYEPSIHIYDVSKGLERTQSVCIPRIRHSLQLVYSSPVFLVLENYPRAWVCYRMEEGNLGFYGIIHVREYDDKNMKLELDKVYDEQKKYNIQGISLLRIINDTMIIKPPNNCLYFICMDPLIIKAQVEIESNFRFLSTTMRSCIFMANDETIKCFNSMGKELASISSSVVSGRDRHLEANKRMIVECLSTPRREVGEGQGERETWVVLRMWSWASKRVGGGELRVEVVRPSLLALDQEEDLLIHCRAEEIVGTSLPSGQPLWRITLNLMTADQLLLVHPRLFLLRTNSDYSLIDAATGRLVFTNSERPECGHVYRHQNVRAFIFYDALFSRIILHIFDSE